MKTLQLVALAVFALFLIAFPVLAQDSAVPSSVSFSGSGLGAGLGAAITLIGAGYGFGKIGSAALESMARQPEVAGPIGTNMLIIGALLEGATFFALLICLLVSFSAKF